VGGRGVRVAFLPVVDPGIEQAVYRRLKVKRLVMSQKRIRFFMSGTITEE
jgi:hypothetical protein